MLNIRAVFLMILWTFIFSCTLRVSLQLSSDRMDADDTQTDNDLRINCYKASH